MKKIILFLYMIWLVPSLTWSAPADTLRYGRFGKIWIYRQTPNPSRVVLFVSGDGGWNLGVIDMARELATLDALVVGIDILHYLRELNKSTEACLYPAFDFEMLSKFVQQELKYANYVTPMLVGYSSGATLVYATLVQAPSNTFKGAISLGFCPDLPLTKSMCRGSGLEVKLLPQNKGCLFTPADALEVPWIALQGTIDQVCNADSTRNFVKKTKNGEIVVLPRVGHGFSVQTHWMPQFKQAFQKIAKNSNESLSPKISELNDLPIVEVPAGKNLNTILALHITGDGGYGVTDKGICQALSEQGIPVVVLNSLSYFWKKRTPDMTAGDVQRILQYYLAEWKKEKIVLIGYSLGADVLPFVINRLPQDLRSKIALVTFLGLGTFVEFEFHLANWMGKQSSENTFRILPEVEKLNGLKMLCIFGGSDQDCLCRTIDSALMTSIELKGGHRIAGNFDPVVQAILKEIPQQPE
jgi:type IV secretory pathway VirJ component